MSGLLRARAKGQVMQIVALGLGLGVLIGFVALAFDGGSALLQRRTMQNAAEAGAQAGIQFMGQWLLGTCDNNIPACWPTYAVKDSQVRARIQEFVRANRGGTVGATDADYSLAIQYHHMVGSPQCPAGTSCYRDPIDDPNTNLDDFVDDWVDGLKVVAKINNPTTFAKTLPGQIDEISVSAAAAARIFPTCSAFGDVGKTLPFTRFRPAVERQMTDTDGNNVVDGNNLCNPFEFWDSSVDTSGGGSNQKNLLSFDTTTDYAASGIGQQLLTAFDERYGPPPGGVGGNYDRNAFQNERKCDGSGSPPDYCADMRGFWHTYGTTDRLLDLQNWIYWLWNGTISYGSQYNAATMTRYPAHRGNNWGRDLPDNSNTIRKGDWAEVVEVGNQGNNIQTAVLDMIRRDGEPAPLTDPQPDGLGWGKAIVRTIYVWGESECAPVNGVIQAPCPNQGNYSSAKSAQVWRDGVTLRCNSGGGGGGPNATPQPTGSGWEDVRVDEQGNQFRVRGSADCQVVSGSPSGIGRVRFTYAYTMIFYEALHTGGNVLGPGGCSISTQSSAARAFLTTQIVTGPSGGGCGWAAGGAAYIRAVDPNDP